ncbi:MAG: AEC family transporter [Mogibacterium sp.]|nr:AEC family transporter [Mogibacterium sp.]
MLIIVGKVISIFAITLIGIAAYKIGVLGEDAIKPLTSLMMNITCPCLVLSSLYSKEFSDSVFDDTITVMICMLLFYMAASALTYFFIRTAKIGHKDDMGVFIAAVAATNSGFMGFPIVRSLYGSDMLYLMVMGNMMLNVFLFWMEPLILTIGTDSRTSAKDILKGLKSPIIFSILAGFIMLSMHIRPEGVVDETIVMIGDVTIPLSMILVGIKLGAVRIKEVASNDNLIISAFAMIVIPTLIIAIMYPIGILNNDIKIIVGMTAVLPTAVVAAVIAEQYDKNSLLLSELVSLTTLMSVITIPVAAIVMELLYR